MSESCCAAVICAACLIAVALAGGTVAFLPAFYDNSVPARFGTCHVAIVNATGTRVVYVLRRGNCTSNHADNFAISLTYLQGNVTCYYAGCRLNLRPFSARPNTVLRWAWGSLGVAFCVVPAIIVCCYMFVIGGMLAAECYLADSYAKQVDV